MSKKKKIGIVTYWESYDNYGQQLQCWALQRYLRSLGYDAFLIRFRRWSPNITAPTIVKYIIRSFWRALHIPNRLKDLRNIYYRKFPLFRYVHLRRSIRVYNNLSQLRKSPPKADVYITGSDQVWSPNLTHDELEAFYLQFGSPNTRRVAYAPSVGQSEYPKHLQEDLKCYLKTFHAISVRELSGVLICNRAGFRAEHVVDPTLLLEQNDYMRLIKGEKRRKNIFIYSLNYTSEDDLPFEEIERYAKNKELPIIVTPSSGYIPINELFVGVEYSYATIGQWINNILNAELVITASFHGIILSVLLHRPFLYTPLSGKYSYSNMRVYDFLKGVGLEKRVWNKENNISAYVVDENWEDVDNKLFLMKSKSKEFLQKSLS